MTAMSRVVSRLARSLAQRRGGEMIVCTRCTNSASQTAAKPDGCRRLLGFEMDLQRGERATFTTMVAAATPSEPKSKDHTEATMQETTGVAGTSNVEERNELRSHGSRGRMLLCWCRDGGKHRPIYWEKIVPWRGKKKDRPRSRPGPILQRAI